MAQSKSGNPVVVGTPLPQILLSICDPSKEDLQAPKLLVEIKKQHPAWYAVNIVNYGDRGLLAQIEKWCKRHPGGNDVIDQPYLTNFPYLEIWERAFALSFQNRGAFLPGIGFKEVCRMTPQERVDAGKYGIRIGRETMMRYRILKRWGIRGGGKD